MDAAEWNRLRWQCRRGMLENDLVLECFLERHGPSLEGARLAAFKRLLEYGDGELWRLVSGRGEVADPALAAVLTELRACSAAGRSRAGTDAGRRPGFKRSQ
ncbi:MAG: succinate dehydrogenase assembly factor 2 [Burkholderiales bacterium]|nr:succinate dehydrogenase assembly factor 2 [Burkholderiales bacterium]